MNENLSKLVHETTPAPAPVFTDSQLDLPMDDDDPHGGIDGEISEQVTEEVVQAQDEIEVAPPIESIATNNLSTWFEQNGTAFDNISRVAIQIRGVSPDGTLIMAVHDPSGGHDTEGNEKRVLRLFEGADVQPVLNIPASFMDVYNIGFQTIHPYENMAIKTYGLRSGLICIFCHVHSEEEEEDKLIPYGITRLKKKDEQLVVLRGDSSDLPSRLTSPLDREAAQLLYKQVSKVVVGFERNINFIDWLLERQKVITDINHHLQIDQVIISLLGY